MSDITRILESMDSGDPNAAEELLPLVYDELRRLAAAKMSKEAEGQTLQPTALVHEAWIRLAGTQSPQWENRGHFFSAAAEAMRRILVDVARRKKRMKHGGGIERVDAGAIEISLPMPEEELLDLDDAINQLAKLNPKAVEVVNLCFFVGLTQEEAAKQLDISRSTAERLWAFARAWLYREIQKTRHDDASQI